MKKNRLLMNVGYLKKIFHSNPFLKSYTILFGGSMIASFLNYIFHPILARIMDPASFGDIQAIISLMTQASVLFGVFSIVVVHITANVKDKNKRNAIIDKLQKISLGIVGVGSILYLFSIEKLQTLLNFYSIYPLLFFVGILYSMVFVMFCNAFLQGSGRFTELSISNILSSGFRLLFAIFFVFLGWGSVGATLGIGIGIVFSYIYSWRKTRKDLRIYDDQPYMLEKDVIRKELVYGVLVLFATMLVTFFFTIDVLVVKYFFSPYEAGIYSGISAIAKILYFAVSPLAGILLYAVTIHNTQKENNLILYKSLGLSILVGSMGLLLLILFYDIITSVFIGKTYSYISYLLPKAGLVMFLSGLVNVGVFYFLALRRFFLVPLSIVSILLSGFLIVIYGNNGIDVILNILLGVLLGVISILFVVYVKDYFHHRSGL